MRKIYLLIISLLAAWNVNAAVYTITVGDFSFTPADVNAYTGDTIRWVWQSGTHSTTSQTIPSCAAPWNAEINSSTPTFQMVLPASCTGTYNYYCTHHTAMVAKLTVTNPAGIGEIDAGANLVFPNPFSEKLSVIYNGIDKVVIYDIVGNAVKEGFLTAGQITELNVADLPKGTYFIRMFRNESVVLTKKLSKI